MKVMAKFYNQNKFNLNQHNYKHRINYQIKCPKVRLIINNRQMGIISIEDARGFAQQNGMDLVEIAPQANPPVCYVMDYKKYLYEEKIKEKSKKTKKEETKEIRFKSCIEENDLNIKIKQAINFLEKGKRLQITLRFRSYRDQIHRDKGKEIIKKFLEAVENHGQLEKDPMHTNDKIICKLIPKK
jgi:translation initiation factor IF-3